MSIVLDPKLARVPKEVIRKGMLLVGASSWAYIDVRPPQGRLWLMVDIRLYLPAAATGSAVYANVRDTTFRYDPFLCGQSAGSPQASFNGQIYLTYDLYLELRCFNAAATAAQFRYSVSIVEL